MNFREHLSLYTISRKRSRMTRAIERHADEQQDPICPGCGQRHPPVNFADVLNMAKHRLAMEPDAAEPIVASGSTKLN